MKQEVRAFLGMVGERRAAHISKADPSAKATYVVDDSTPRAVVKVEKEGRATALEFIETAETAAIPSNMEDYVFAANEVGTVGVALPESGYSRDIAAIILKDLESRIMSSGAVGRPKFNGYLYDGTGNFKKVL